MQRPTAFSRPTFSPQSYIRSHGNQHLVHCPAAMISFIPKSLDANHAEGSLILALTSIAMGLLVEDIGSRIESRLFDKHLTGKSEFSGHDEEWGRYLRLTFSTEPGNGTPHDRSDSNSRWEQPLHYCCHLPLYSSSASHPGELFSVCVASLWCCYSKPVVPTSS